MAVAAAGRDVDVEASDGADLDGYVLETNSAPASAWDAMAAGFADATLEQTVAYLAPRYGADRLLGLLLRDAGGDIVACALAVLIVLPLLGVGLAYVKFGPLVRQAGRPAAPRHLRAMLRALRAELCGRRRLSLRLVPPADPEAGAIWPAALRDAELALSGAVADSARYFVDVSLDEAAQRASLSALWRANLVKAEAAGLTLREGTFADDLPVFMRLYADMRARQGFVDRQRTDAAPAVIAALPPAYRPRIFLASKAGEAVAATILAGAGDRVGVAYSASSAEAAPLRAGYALRWHVMKALRGSGVRWLDLGGGACDPGLRHFMEGNVGKRGRVVDIPGEFAAEGSALSERMAAAAMAIRARVDWPLRSA